MRACAFVCQFARFVVLFISPLFSFAPCTILYSVSTLFFLFLFPHLHFSFFFFNDTATTEIYTLSLHDALPISWAEGHCCSPGRHRGGTAAGRWSDHPRHDQHLRAEPVV